MQTTTTTTTTARPLFGLGQTVATPGALDLVSDPADLVPFLARHHRGDWGDTGRDADPGEMSDWELNDFALLDGSRIFSVYQLGEEKIWIITDAADEDGRRASTCIMTPEDY